MKPPFALPGDAEAVIGANIRALRQHRRCTQTALARALGITFQQVQKYESGSNRVTASRLHAMAHYLDVPYEYFFHGLPGIQTPDMVLIRDNGDALEAMRLVEGIADPARRHQIVQALRVLAL